MNIAIHSKKFKPNNIHLLKDILTKLPDTPNTNLLLSKDLALNLKENGLHEFIQERAVFSDEKELENVDCAISIGGDGTLLSTLTYIKEREIPVLGINAGRLGFLATTSKDKVKEAFDAIINGYYTVEKRIMLQLVSDRDVFSGLNFGLNEFTILKRDTSSMIVVHTFLDGEYLNSYWADGLIVATPTGSTGYSLSVGGPLVIPGSGNFVISPVCPHNLNVRPLVVSDHSVISFEIEGRSKNFLVSLDSRSASVDASIQIAVKKCDFSANLVKFSGDNFLNTLRLKLNWGLDARN